MTGKTETTELHEPPAGFGSDIIFPYEAAEIVRLRGEIERLRAAVAYCRKRLRQPAYAAALDRILAGQTSEPDHTPMTGG